MQKERLVVLTFLISVIFIPTQINAADLELGRLFSSGAVLQQGKEVPIWGWAEPGEFVTINFNGYSGTLKVDDSGRWETRMPPMRAGGPFQMVVNDSTQRLVINNILIGEVWICSGQSNMAWLVEQSSNADYEIANSNWPEIRHFEVPRQVANRPQLRLEGGEWQSASPGQVGRFTAVGYFFARELYKHYQVPIGLIHTSWGGTIVETWTSPEAIRTIEPYQSVVDELQALDLEQLAAERRRKIEEILGEPFPEEDPGMMDGRAAWAEEGVDRSGWKEMTLPSLWEDQGLDGLDGIIWFSREFELTQEQVENASRISLGPIDDTDITWLNGQRIGAANRYNEPRIYEVTPSQLRPGRNLLVVRVTDTGGGGGIYGAPEELYVDSGSEKIPLAGSWKYKVGAVQFRETLGPNTKPTLLYNGMVSPLIPYAFQGVIWYQGESNTAQAYQYRDNFPLMIQDWRQKWGGGDFPFLFVQLANFMQPAKEPGDSNWAELREAQTMTLSLPNTGQAVIIDIGEADDIHPKNKQDVGFRLSLAARRVAYGEDIVYSGPTYESMRIVGDKVYIRFSNTGNGLLSKGTAGIVHGFVLSGPDRKFRRANAMIYSDQEVVVFTRQVSNPVAVRYGWADNPDDLNLYNREGLPACPFRSDDWPGATMGQFRIFD